jgi:hypothetical protein
MIDIQSGSGELEKVEKGDRAGAGKQLSVGLRNLQHSLRAPLPLRFRTRAAQRKEIKKSRPALDSDLRCC